MEGAAAKIEADAVKEEIEADALKKGGKEGRASAEEPLPLEEAFARLDAIMEKLEQEKISLEDSFLLYQQGMKLLKQCNDSIDRVEKQLIILEEEGI